MGILISLIMMLSQPAYAGDYCLALRGNGELAPAHWGAMANVVEKLGLPAMQAGGSSASITMMLNEAVALNPFVKEGTAAERRVKAALLIKSLEGFVEYLTNSNQWKDLLVVYQAARTLRQSDWLEQLNQFFKNHETLSPEEQEKAAQQYIDLLRRNYQTGVRLGLISPSNYAPLYESLGRLTRGDYSRAQQDLKVSRFYLSELKETIRVFGAFDAQTDNNLFFRPGVVDFGIFAEQIGRVASFLSASNAGAAVAKQWRDFFSQCATISYGRTWDEITTLNPECATQYYRVIATYFSGPIDTNFATYTAGKVIPSFPTTAVLTGSAYKDAKAAMTEYRLKMDGNFGAGFKLSNPEDLKFGFWGAPDTLTKIESQLPKWSDEKSRRFMPLGEATWRSILSLSPAEPGLASFQEFELEGTPLISAGGWSDLHPVLVLKAAGCEKVVYITRRGGESLFAQGVAKRLLGYDRDWKDLKARTMLDGEEDREDKRRITVLNNKGDISDMTSLWSKLFNLANPQSSFRSALNQADAVLCTDWNRFDVKNGIRDMIREAYRSPYFVRNRAAFASEPLWPELNARDVHPDGYPMYAGCH